MRISMARAAVIAAVTGLGCLTGLPPAFAIVITPNLNANNGEPNLYQVMNNMYGAGNWQQLDDSAIQSDINGGGSTLVNFQTRYAADTLTFGIFKDSTTFDPLMTVGNAGASPESILVTSSMRSTNIGGTFELGMLNDTTGVLFSSNNSQNPDQRAHLIEFQILNQPDTFVMAWEDSVDGDYDYNDLILQYSIDPDPAPVPEPMTLSLLGGMLAFAGIARRRIKKSLLAP